jgi:uncharacterized integral membrane protein (TIGR00698 family)
MRTPGRNFYHVLPGVLLCAAVTLGAAALERIEVHLFGHAWLETLVLAIVTGCAVRSLYGPGTRFNPGLRFSAKTLLELAVALMGASVSAGAMLEHGLGLMGAIALAVLAALLCSYGIGRLMGLPRRMAILIACGNSICGNSAITAVAPVIDASSDDVAASIAFTAVLGVGMVVALPLLAPLLPLSAIQFGIFAGLTVYAVPQVLAATAPVAVASVHIGTLVKLARVLMLGPVVLGLSLASSFGARQAQAKQPGNAPSLARLVPWFIAAFLALMLLRSCDALPRQMLMPLQSASSVLTVMSMAALGLGVDVRSVLRAGRRVAITVTLSLLALAAISYLLISLLALP